MLASSLALLSASLAGFDSGGASCHARQQLSVVISVIGGLRFRERELPRSQQLSVVINAVGGLRFRGRELPCSPAAWRCYQRHWRASTPGARAATGGHSGPALPGGNIALLSTPLAGFDSGGASCHARRQPGVVISVIGGLRFRGRELPRSQQLGVVISVIGGHSGPALPGGNIALLSASLAGTAALPGGKIALLSAPLAGTAALSGGSMVFPSLRLGADNLFYQPLQGRVLYV